MINKHCEKCKKITMHHFFKSNQTQCLKCGIGNKKTNPYGYTKQEIEEIEKEVKQEDEQIILY